MSLHSELLNHNYLEMSQLVSISILFLFSNIHFYDEGVFYDFRNIIKQFLFAFHEELNL